MKKNLIAKTSILLVLSLTLSACGTQNTSASATTQDVVSESKEETPKKETGKQLNIAFGNSTEEENVAKNDNTEELALRDSSFAEKYMRAGCAVTGSEIDDAKVWDIITTHFNAVTLGNELKPDALVNYSCSSVPGTEVAELNGEDIVVPKLNYSRADKILNKILDWNEKNPDREIKVRGHVLVWHSQTPEWFFHEDYDKNKPYADIATMNKRLEWYIKTVLTYYTGEESKYKDLFYGWDVVNEAVSDQGGYRTDNENPNEKLSEDRHGSNSSWWHVYGSNEYIINAFKYANKYAPGTLELYYNDYNETSPNKSKTIIELLTAVKEAEGAPGEGTRIDAMGMQGHYNVSSSNPSESSISMAIKDYCKVVSAVQFTEVDLKISDAYDSTEEGIKEMNEKIKSRYAMINFAIKNALNEEDVNITGFTFWGTVDHYSWLQSQSNVGGGNTTKIPQLPLLFDSNYEPKSCFYVFCK